MKSPKILVILFVFVSIFGLYSTPGTLHAQTFNQPELLGRPTANSVTLHVVVSTTVQTQFKVQYGTTSGVYPDSTAPVTVAASSSNVPVTIVISGLSPNTKYYYQLGSSTNGTTWTWRTSTPAHSFYTQRELGSTYKFTITTDGHVGILLGTAATQQQTLTNVGTDNPDFHIDLGDTVAMDNGNTGGSVTTETAARNAYLTQRSATYFGKISHSVPIFLVAGNHEQTEGWHRLVNNLPFWSINARKRYFLNPVPDAFYSGNTDNTFTAIVGDVPSDHLLGNYYAWNWGDALFVVIDPFWYTTTKAKNDPATYGGGEDTGAGSGDRWDWTLGDAQYNWLTDVLESSSAKYKFLIMHHPTGGTDDYIRGGAIAGTYVEWGGNNENGSGYPSAFTSRRPTWPKPIHQVLVDNKVSAVFHGHDHQFVYETRDGIVYQEVPSAGGAAAFGGVYSEGDHGSYNTIEILTNPGHLRITVAPTQATVDYIATTGGGVSYTYNIAPAATCQGDFDADGVVDGKDLALLIATPSLMPDVAIFAQNFGKTVCP